MRKVQNKKAIRNLADKSFAANRVRNRIAVLAIALTAMLFTTLFTIGIGTAENFQRETMRQAGGDSHGVFKDLTKEQYEKLKDHPLIKESAACVPVADRINNPEFLKRHVEAWYYPQYHYPHCFIEIMDGKAPEKADEILMDEVSMELLGLKKKAGQKVTLKMQIGMEKAKEYEREFTVSGVIKADSALNTGFVIVSEAYVKEHKQELTDALKEEYGMTGRIRMDVSFSNSFGIQKKLNQIITESGYSAKEGDKNYIASNGNWAYISDGGEKDPMTIGAAAGGLALILLTGYLIIYNIFQISVIRDIRYYGLLKTIGTTGRQVKRILRRQAWKLSIAGIPLGLLAGFFVGKAFVPIVLARSSYQIEDTVVSLDIRIFLGAALFTLATVFISVHKPAKIAAKVSPVEAVRYTDGMKQRKRQKKSTDGGRIARMAMSNLGRSKGRTAIVIISLSLAVILLNTVFTITGSFDMNKYLKKFVTSDFLIANARYFGMEYYGLEGDAEEKGLTESFIKACESQDGFERGGRIYMSEEIGLDKKSYKVPDYIKTDNKGNIYWTWGSEKIPYNETENGDYRAEVYGLDDVPLSDVDVWDGEKNIDTIKEKLSTGKYLLMAVQTDDNDFVMEDKIMCHVGDKVTLVLQNGEKREFEILSLIKENYYGLSNRMGNQFPFYTTSEVYKEMASDKSLMSYAFYAEDDKEAEIGTFLKNYTEIQEPLMHYESKQKWLDDFQGLIGLFVLVGTSLSFVIGVIGVLNFINSILTGIVTRKKEFAMMEAIGMTRKQLGRMLEMEGLYYALFAVLCSGVLGSIFSLTAVQKIAGGIWFMSYRFIIWPMLVIYPVFLLLGVIVPKAAYRSHKKISLIERIRFSE